MKKIKQFFLMLIILGLCCQIIACGNTNQSDETSPENTRTEGAKDEHYPVTVYNYGRELVIDQKPSKVLTLGPNCTELFVALGLNEYVIGRSLVNHSRGPLKEYEAAVNAIPQLNYAEATREAILSSGADFIYTLDWELSDEGCNIEEVTQYGMKVYVNTATTLEEQYQEIMDMGKIFQVEDVAKEFVEDQKARISAVEDKVKTKERLNVLVYDSGNQGVFTCSGTNFESLLIQCAGGNNIFADLKDKQWVTVSYEEVLKRKPDIILVHDYDAPSLEAKIAEIKSNPVLAQLDCVKNDRFASITLESVLPGDRMAYTVETLYQQFYSE